MVGGVVMLPRDEMGALGSARRPAELWLWQRLAVLGCRGVRLL